MLQIRFPGTYIYIYIYVCVCVCVCVCSYVVLVKLFQAMIVFFSHRYILCIIYLLNYFLAKFWSDKFQGLQFPLEYRAWGYFFKNHVKNIKGFEILFKFLCEIWQYFKHIFCNIINDNHIHTLIALTSPPHTHAYIVFQFYLYLWLFICLHTDTSADM